MAAVRGKDTRPEFVVRALVHRLGYRFRLHVRSLPGCPDLVFPKHRKVIFVHGCFWHRHRCRKGRSMPSTRVSFWQTKLTQNASRDRLHRRRLRRQGWQILVVWECETTGEKSARLQKRVEDFLQQ
jgi:DNA mismatch endonuclease (patch repair protein)